LMIEFDFFFFNTLFIGSTFTVIFDTTLQLSALGKGGEPAVRG
jgi:hypothetical protein